MDFIKDIVPWRVPWNKIRMGGACDGGYIISENLLSLSRMLVSAGIGYDYNFEMEYYRRTRYPVVMWDPVGYTDPFFTPSLVQRREKLVGYPKNDECIFKCDIEGDEYVVLKDWQPYLPSPLGMVVEWHNVGERMGEFLDLHEKILKSHVIYHIHGNNFEGTFKLSEYDIPRVLEISYIRFDLMGTACQRDRGEYPTGVDFPNNPHRLDHRLKWIQE